MALIDSLTNFRVSVAEANSFIALAFQQDGAGNYVLPQNQREFISDSAYLKLFIAWETFLENSFIQYMLGEPSVLGHAVIRYVQPIDEQHANKLLIGTQKYVDWSNPEIVKRLCNLYFAADNPIGTFVSSMMADLFDLKTVRNAAAHLTTTTRQQLDSVGTRKLKRACTDLKVSDFIFAVDPDSTISETILTTYLNKLDISAEGIANG
ncbi:MAG: hypothetical protein IPO78_11095 [Saprospiraceae bacterium]|uniref:Uncharacterized protein n=1 Tax=Candidatus Defluviibacterium haderslevense TaxID=2981993 RepID=A0A9D7XJR3_9BACT|nr:hypothetical protein [Candidatus Defluviibacterium haderslevense]MBK9722144.1 hypothetical protein [Saprospiraceae bacterium]